MLNEREKLEHDVLAIIEANSQPLGCGTLSQLLQAKGYNLSEATVGRVLRDLDFQGYTQKAGFQGRLLSQPGSARLAELATKLRGREWGDELAKALQGHTKEQLLEVLVARRGIESEIAYLAATNRTAEEIEQLAAIVARQQASRNEEGSAAQEDVEFHSLIAQMARNGILKAAIEIIRQDPQLSPVLEYIRRHVQGLGYIDHQRLADAIIAGQPDKAREVMIEHINNLIRDVEIYWQMTADSQAM